MVAPVLWGGSRTIVYENDRQLVFYGNDFRDWNKKKFTERWENMNFISRLIWWVDASIFNYAGIIPGWTEPGWIPGTKK